MKRPPNHAVLELIVNPDSHQTLALAFTVLRMRLGWTQTKLGKVLGISQSAVSRIEVGENEVLPVHIRAFYAAAGGTGRERAPRAREEFKQRVQKSLFGG